MTAGNIIPTEIADREFIFTRVFDAPRSLVFKAWIDPKHMARWWGPHGFTTPVCELDARPGGALHMEMCGPDGVIYPMKGIFQGVNAPEELSFIGSALDGEGKPFFETLHTVTFTEKTGKTTLTLKVRVIRWTPGAAPYLDGLDAGWNQGLERLENYLPVAKSEAVKSGVADTSDREIIISRLFNAPRELVFDAWTDSSHVSHWWGPRGFTITTHEMEVRPGGVWRFIMHGPNGVDYPNWIAYEEVMRPERLIFAHGGAADEPAHFHTTVTFATEDNKTLVTMKSVFPTAEARDKVVKEYGAIEGGKQTLERLAEFVEKDEG